MNLDILPKVIEPWDTEGSLAIVFPVLPPGANSTYGYGRGRVYLTHAARAWAEKAALVIGATAGAQGWKKTADYYGIVILWSGSKMDEDAPIKLVQDTVTRKLGFDDRAILQLVVRKLLDAPKGLLIVLHPIKEA